MYMYINTIIVLEGQRLVTSYMYMHVYTCTDTDAYNVKSAYARVDNVQYMCIVQVYVHVHVHIHVCNVHVHVHVCTKYTLYLHVHVLYAGPSILHCKLFLYYLPRSLSHSL